ncbi:MAG: S9 family peptidase [Rickettsiales bacterium]|jgi:dipeptidyl aminopeptidase/acylaminoacyl peptidase|nr:S9 family peptidase [Rickettsiales bacterium]
MRLKIISIILIISLIFISYLFINRSNQVIDPIIPRSVLFGNPDKFAARISPNGEYISYIAPSNGVLNIWLAPRDDIDSAKVITDDDTRGIRNYTWAYDNKHLLYSLDNKGDENYRVYSINIETGVTELLTPETAVRAYVSYVSHRFPNEALISTNERDKQYFDIYKYNLTTGNRELVLENTKFDDVVIDEDLQIRFASFIAENGGREYFKFEDNSWQPFMEVPFDDITSTNLYGFSEDGNVLYLSDSRNLNTAALKSINLETGEENIIAKDDKSDVNIFTSHPTKNIIQAIGTTYLKSEYKLLDDSIKDDMLYLESVANGGEIIIGSRSIDDKHWIVVIMSDDASIKYYQYDRDKKTANFLFSHRSMLDQYKLAKMYPVIIKSRDGLDLVSYITFPRNSKLNNSMQPENPLPLVLNVHGGPRLRDYWGFDPEHQWLANRGYAVLSVNYRASSGFGKDFLNAGNGQWGKKMHDDLIDAVNWAISNKIANPKKISIYGGSYGGYAALVGLTMTPDVFACAVDIVGPANLITLLENVPPYWGPYLNAMKKWMGPWETEEDKQALLQVSPISFVDNIKKPLLIAQGANDPRVNQIESDQIVEKMQSKNIPVVYALYPDEGHGFARPENRISFYALAEQFLAKVLGGRAQPIDEDLEGANLILNGVSPKNALEAENIIGKEVKQ